MANWLLMVFVSLLLLWGIGSPIAAVLSRTGARSDIALIAPFLGFSAIAAVCSYLGIAGVAAQKYAWLLIVLALGGLVVVRRSLWASLRHHWRVLAICAATYVFAMGVVIALGYLTTVGATIDALSYATRSEYLRESALVLPATPAGHPFYGWVADHLDRIRVGDVYFLAVVGALVGVRSYQMLTVVAGLFFALLPASVYLFARRTLELQPRPALLAAAMVGIHNLLIWVVYDNFLSQMLAIGLVVVLLYAVFDLIDTRGWRALLLFSLLLSGLIAMYPVYALPAVLAGGAYGLLALTRQLSVNRRHGFGSAGRYLVWGVGALGIAGLWNAVAVAQSYTETAAIGALLFAAPQQTVGPGNLDVFVPTYVMAGLAMHSNVAYRLAGRQLPPILLMAGAVVWCALLCWGWLQLSKTKRLQMAVVLAVLVGLALQQRFGINQPDGYPYGYFKLATLIAVVTLPLLAVALHTPKRAPRLRYLAWAFVLGFVALNVFNSVGTMQYVYASRVVLDRDMIAVEQAVSAVPADEWIWLDLEPGLSQNWVGYLLKDHLIQYREPIQVWSWPVMDAPKPPPGYQYALIERSLIPKRSAAEPWYQPDSYVVVWSNSSFELRQRITAQAQ